MIIDLIGTEIKIYVNNRKHPYYRFRAVLAYENNYQPGIWEDANTPEEAIGRLIIETAKGTNRFQETGTLE